MKIFFWSPFISQVATKKAVINSALSLKKFSNNKLPYIINVAGEWDDFTNSFKNQNINLINLTESKVLKKKNYTGFVFSRLIYLYIFFISFFPLIKILKKEKPDYFIIHLISPLPLLINMFLKNNTKFVLRVSGLPKLEKNLLRFFLWKITFKKLNFVTCPTKATYDYLLSKNIISEKKIFILYDPIINVKEIKEKEKTIQKKSIKFYNNYFIAIGRLTKQKNFLFLIKCFEIYNKNKKNKLLILGEGEEYSLLKNYIEKKHLNNDVILLGYQENIYTFLNSAKCFVLSSLWEDPGFVLVEAGFSNVFVISSDCQNGPTEILDKNKNGILFKSNTESSLINAFKKFDEMGENEKKVCKVKLKKNIKKFTLFSHFKKLSYLLEKNEKSI